MCLVKVLSESGPPTDSDLLVLGLCTAQTLPNPDSSPAKRKTLDMQALEAFIDLVLGLRNPLGRSLRPCGTHVPSCRPAGRPVRPSIVHVANLDKFDNFHYAG